MASILLENIKLNYGETTILEDFNLEIEDNSFTVIVGPSGCGKTTLLRVIAGLESPTKGRILIDGKEVTYQLPGNRDIAMVFQNYALYPTMTVKENIEFGLVNQKVPKSERQKLINDVIEIVDLGPHLHKKPNALSGGQQQRVALARAIVKKPKVFLMDEPLSNLDASLRNQMRSELIELYNQLNTTFIFVTHDQTEALSMSTRLVLMNAGKIVQADIPENIYSDPTNLFAASFIGTPSMNIIDLKKYPLDNIFEEEICYVGFRPHDCQLVEKKLINQNSKEIILEGTILTNELYGSERLYRIDTNVGKLTITDTSGSNLACGQQVICSISEDKLYFFDISQNRVR